MRKEFCNKIEQLGKQDKNIIFLSGDVGFKALEGVRELFGERFINMGVAEQNMISVAAGLALEGYKVFCYSIAPFVVYRCLEQIRNDVCFHKLPVFIVGNGGGYGYGIMGPSHHALEDLACLTGLPNMSAYVPAFDSDVNYAIETMLAESAPAYLRLGLANHTPLPVPPGFFYPLVTSSAASVTIAALGPIANNVLEALENPAIKNKADVFSITRLPFKELPQSFVQSLKKTKKLLVAEEHVNAGGLGQCLATAILEENIPLSSFISLTSQGYPGGLYGNQSYHQQRSGLDAQSIGKLLESL